MCTCDCGWAGSSDELNEVTADSIGEDISLGYVTPDEVGDLIDGYFSCPECGSRVEPD